MATPTREFLVNTLPGEAVDYGSPLTGAWGEIVRIARAQRVLIWVMLMTLVTLVPVLLVMEGRAAKRPAIPEFVIDVATAVMMATAFGALEWAMVGVLRALGLCRGGVVGCAVAFAVVCLLPPLSLYMLIIVVKMATERLREAGVKVGLMGASLPKTV